jgi:hypothetical protein
MDLIIKHTLAAMSKKIIFTTSIEVVMRGGEDGK